MENDLNNFNNNNDNERYNYNNQDEEKSLINVEPDYIYADRTDYSKDTDDNDEHSKKPRRAQTIDRGLRNF